MNATNVSDASQMPLSHSQDEDEALLVKYWVWAVVTYFIAALIAAALGAKIVSGNKFNVISEIGTTFQAVSFQTPFRMSLLKSATTPFLETDQFQDPALELLWQEQTYADTIRNGSLLLHVWLWGMCAYRTFRNMMIDDCSSPVGIPEFCEYVGFAIMLGLTALCRLRPRQSLYWPTLLLICGYVLGSTLPPLQWSCFDLRQPTCQKSMNEFMVEAVNNHDCSPTAITATLLYMTWLCVMPWLVHNEQMLHIAWVWIAVYFAWSILYKEIKETRVFNKWDVLQRTLVLSTTLVISTIKKHYLQSSSIKKFLANIETRRASEKIFRVFQYMVPTHIVYPMLRNPGQPIAESLDKATIMFIIITDFDAVASKSTPKELLSYLNDVFSKMDNICMANGVTKVETVGEEYVACVGVVPDDIAEAREHGYKRIMARLFQAGNDILQLQAHTLKFKIGVHTGPIVAGVIGDKLPRYRLFGDTINTAARMMQKGTIGRMQFGESTHNELPKVVECSYRGEVEMKGKGMVKAWLLEKMLDKMDCAPSAAGEDSQTFVVAMPSMARGSHGGMMREKFDKDLFESVNAGMATSVEQDTSVPSLFPVFTPAMEKQWFQEFHEKTFMKKFQVRLTRQLGLICVMTVFETLFIIAVIIHYDRHFKDYKFRFVVYFSCRMISMGLVLFWRRYHLKWTEWMDQSAVTVQRLMLLTTWCILLLTFVSHNVLTLHKEKGSMRREDPALHGPPSDQLFLPIFVLSYQVFATTHSLRFYPSIHLLPLSAIIMYLCQRGGLGPDSISLGSLFFSTSGKVLFMIHSVLNVFLSYNEEQGSRLRFQARMVVEETRNRTETILSKLMPPLVVEELRASQGGSPSHEYNKVTLQQSDLCGFTKLAATRTPSEVVDFMSELFGMFDRLTDKYGIYKVETIGDAYIAGMGEKPLTSENKPSNVMRFGLESVRAVNAWSEKLGGERVGCRVGIAHGQCIGGVVGTDMQRYHLFGSLMSCLEILESCGKEGMVQVSTAAYQAVLKDDPNSDLVFVKRTDTTLTTSKGEEHNYEEAGGETYFVSLKQPGETGGEITLAL